jgi:DNA-binding NarL/FixJ family response regulator
MANRIISKIVGGEMVSESPVTSLSDRELEVLSMIGRGRRYREIAEALNISVRTVDAHREHIKKKLNLEDATALTRYAIEWDNDEAGPTRL